MNDDKDNNIHEELDTHDEVVEDILEDDMDELLEDDVEEVHEEIVEEIEHNNNDSDEAEWVRGPGGRWVRR